MSPDSACWSAMSATARALSVRSMVVADMRPQRIKNRESRIPTRSRVPSPESRVQIPVNYRLGSHPQESCDGQSRSPAGITRRQFGAMTAGSLVAAASSSTVLGQTSTSPAPGAVLDIADWSYYWYGLERVKLARGTLRSSR